MKITEKVKALLAKARSSEHPEEAEAFFAKAAELMRRHSIDETLLSGGCSGPIIERTRVLDGPYASPRSSLITAVGAANNVVVLMAGREATLIGRATDIDTTEILFEELNAHALAAMGRAEVPAGVRPRTFRHSFLLGFATRINARFIEAAAQAEADAVEEYGSGVSIVLAGSKADVDAFVADNYKFRSSRATCSSRAGYLSGVAAADGVAMGESVGAGEGRMLGGAA